MDKWEVRSHATTPSCPHNQEAYTWCKWSVSDRIIAAPFSQILSNYDESSSFYSILYTRNERKWACQMFPRVCHVKLPRILRKLHIKAAAQRLTGSVRTVVANHGQSPSCYCKTASTDVTASICSTLNSILRKYDQVSIFYSICTQRMRGGNRAFLTVNQQQPCSKAVFKWAAAAAVSRGSCLQPLPWIHDVLLKQFG